MASHILHPTKKEMRSIPGIVTQRPPWRVMLLRLPGGIVAAARSIAFEIRLIASRRRRD